MAKETGGGRYYAMEAVRVTEAAALAAWRLMGRGDEKDANLAAVDAMQDALKGLAIRGTIRIGEGGEGQTPKLFVGEEAGNGDGPKVDVALMPLEGATIVAKGEPNALSIVAMAEEGGFLEAPDIYMEKIAVGGGLPDGIVDLDREPAANLGELAKAKGVGVGDLVVCILDRPRHGELIARIREAGARIMLIADGDVSGVIATALPETGVDIYMGIGGTPQGVLAAAAMRCLGGQMQGRMVVRSDADRKLAFASGFNDLERKYAIDEMAAGEVTFAATGITSGVMLSGVRRRHGRAVTNSLVMRSLTGNLRHIVTQHRMPPRAG